MQCCLTAAWEVLLWQISSSKWDNPRDFKLFYQIGARLPQNSSVYGFGEQEQHSFKLSMDWVREMVFLEHYLSMFISVHSLHVCKGSSTRRGHQHVSRTSFSVFLCNFLFRYGVHPRYTVLEEDGSTHGVLFLNSNAQEVESNLRNYEEL